MKFKLLELNLRKFETTSNTIYLLPDNWDDYTYKTTFTLYYVDENNIKNEIGTVKIAPIDNLERPSNWTKNILDDEFPYLPENIVSLGQDVTYYENIYQFFNENERKQFLKISNDVVYNDHLLKKSLDSSIFSKSLLRTVSLPVIEGQFKRVLNGAAALTDFNFYYKIKESETCSELNLHFNVEPLTTPPTNLHAIIGRNGIGKTTILNGIINSICGGDDSKYFGSVAKSFTHDDRPVPIDDGYFSSVTSVSFSAFDPFNPNRANKNKKIKFHYVGLKRQFNSDENSDKYTEDAPLKSKHEITEEFTESLYHCLRLPAKRKLWCAAMVKLSSDSNFKDLSLYSLTETDDIEFGEDDEDFVKSRINQAFNDLSSGHSIVLLTITKLVETVEEKTLVLLDEPESHLHPPLLSALIRALSDLLTNRNAVAIIATHSPVVIQEMPKSCVWKIDRRGEIFSSTRPERETFGENVGTLTRDIFGLDVEKSGFHDLLNASVHENPNFNDIVKKYKNQLGNEAISVLMSLVNKKNDSN